jgi:hypothetical protein
MSRQSVQKRIAFLEYVFEQTDSSCSEALDALMAEIAALEIELSMVAA